LYKEDSFRTGVAHHGDSLEQQREQLLEGGAHTAVEQSGEGAVRHRVEDAHRALDVDQAVLADDGARALVVLGQHEQHRVRVDLLAPEEALRERSHVVEVPGERIEKRLGRVFAQRSFRRPPGQQLDLAP
jgi:hypothetical protein